MAALCRAQLACWNNATNQYTCHKLVGESSYTKILHSMHRISLKVKSSVLSTHYTHTTSGIHTLAVSQIIRVQSHAFWDLQVSIASPEPPSPLPSLPRHDLLTGWQRNDPEQGSQLMVVKQGPSWPLVPRNCLSSFSTGRLAIEG